MVKPVWGLLFVLCVLARGRTVAIGGTGQFRLGVVCFLFGVAISRCISSASLAVGGSPLGLVYSLWDVVRMAMIVYTWYWWVRRVYVHRACSRLLIASHRRRPLGTLCRWGARRGPIRSRRHNRNRF